MSRTQLEDETINFVSDEGFTPFLWYIYQFLQMKGAALSAINGLVTSACVAQGKIAGQQVDDEHIVNEAICE